MHIHTSRLYRPAVGGTDYYSQLVIAGRPGSPTYDEAMYDLRHAAGR